MAPKCSLFLFIIIILSVLAVFLGTNEAGTFVGGWRPIENLKDPEVVKIAQYAVAEHNKEAKTSLSLVSVVKGETQVVSGTKYRLVVAARDGSATVSDDQKNYIAVVWSKPWQKFKQLLSFGEI